MEPNKLEKEIREQLHSREIMPSKMAWEKLDAMLTQEGKPKTKFPWLYAAASLLGLSLIGTLYFSSEKNNFVIEKDKVVVQPKEVLKVKVNLLDSVGLTETPKSSSKAERKAQTSFVVHQEQIKPISKDSNKNKIRDGLVENRPIENKEELVQYKSITEESLLQKVEQSARISNSDSELKVHVNPNLLLQQVETDLEPTFRQRVFSKIAQNYEKVKEAVVNRNQE